MNLAKLQNDHLIIVYQDKFTWDVYQRLFRKICEYATQNAEAGFE